MPTRNDTLFERWIAPVARLFMDQESFKQAYAHLDWSSTATRLSDPSLTYPSYYSSQNFHGIEGGYLNKSAAISYDLVTQYALPPNETWVRQGLIDAIQSKPRRILDLGCGTGSTTLLLKQAFPSAEVIGLDLSPYMLAIAEDKAQKAGLAIQWRHGSAEHPPFPDASFDLVTASLLFHETPSVIAKAILQESHRLLQVGGEVAVLDGSQKTLRQTEWLMDIFEEPYIHDYASGSIEAWMGGAGFDAVRTQDIFVLHQVTRGVKPLPYNAVEFSSAEDFGARGDRQWSMG